MDSKYYFNLVYNDERKPDDERNLTREDIIAIFEQAEGRLDIHEGGLFVFNDSNFMVDIERILDMKYQKNKNSKVTLVGKFSESTGEPANPFVAMLAKKEYAGVFYNNWPPEVQEELGYTHEIIVDSGKRICFSELDLSGSYRCLFYEDYPDFGAELIKRSEHYILFYELVGNDIDVINENTLYDSN